MLAPRLKLWSTPQEVILTALEMLNLKKDDILYDIGAGDGRFLIHAIKETDVSKCIGIEIHEERVVEAKKLIEEALGALSCKCEIIQANALEEDISNATALFLYLIPRGLRLILPKLKAIHHHFRVVTYMSPLPDSTPSKIVKVTSALHPEAQWPIYLYDFNVSP